MGQSQGHILVKMLLFFVFFFTKNAQTNFLPLAC